MTDFHYNREAIEAGAPNPLDRFWYGLTFARGDRTIAPFGIDGPEIPNARHDLGSWSKQSPGDWSSEIDDSGDDALAHVIRCAVQEAVHEALEWLRLDGKQILNPHGEHEVRIFNLVDELVDGLWSLATEAIAKQEAP